MKWLQAAVVVCSGVVMTGCPSEFGKDGRVAKAVHKDAMGITRKYCTPQEHREYCEGGKEHTQKCREMCGE